jgi:hypothetical protein
MTERKAPTEREVDQQFWQRCLAALGIMWGLIPLITLPFMFTGLDAPRLGVFAVVFNSLTLLPVCVLVLWHRFIACVWMTVNALLIAIALPHDAIRNHHNYGVGIIIGAVVPVLLAIFFDIAEIRNWPPAIERKEKP